MEVKTPYFSASLTVPVHSGAHTKFNDNLPIHCWAINCYEVINDRRKLPLKNACLFSYLRFQFPIFEKWKIQQYWESSSLNSCEFSKRVAGRLFLQQSWKHRMISLEDMLQVVQVSRGVVVRLSISRCHCIRCRRSATSSHCTVNLPDHRLDRFPLSTQNELLCSPSLETERIPIAGSVQLRLLPYSTLALYIYRYVNCSDFYR